MSGTDLVDCVRKGIVDEAAIGGKVYCIITIFILYSTQTLLDLLVWALQLEFVEPLLLV